MTCESWYHTQSSQVPPPPYVPGTTTPSPSRDNIPASTPSSPPGTTPPSYYRHHNPSSTHYTPQSTKVPHPLVITGTTTQAPQPKQHTLHSTVHQGATPTSLPSMSPHTHTHSKTHKCHSHISSKERRWVTALVPVMVIIRPVCACSELL